MIKAVFFDVGGTLIHPFPSVGEIYMKMAAKHAVHVLPKELEECFKREWEKKKIQHKSINKSWWRETVQAVFSGRAFKNFDVFFDDLYQTFALAESWSLYPDALPVLKELRNRNIRLAVVSNWDDRLPALLESLELSQFFERQFISANLGVIKPDPDIFHIALGAMQLNPLEAIHVGDDYEEDIKGAEAAGMRAYLINRSTKPLSSRSMVNLGEILVRV